MGSNKAMDTNRDMASKVMASSSHSKAMVYNRRGTGNKDTASKRMVSNSHSKATHNRPMDINHKRTMDKVLFFDFDSFYSRLGYGQQQNHWANYFPFATPSVNYTQNEQKQYKQQVQKVHEQKVSTLNSVDYTSANFQKQYGEKVRNAGMPFAVIQPYLISQVIRMVSRDFKTLEKRKDWLSGELKILKCVNEVVLFVNWVGRRLA